MKIFREKKIPFAKILVIAFLFFLILFVYTCTFQNHTSIPGSNDKTLISIYPPLDNYHELNWQDDFNESSLDTSVWQFENENYWEYGEYQLFTNDNQNVTIHDGHLNIILKERITSSKDTVYTSAFLSTRGKKEFKHGRYDIRAKLPFGNGLLSLIALKESNDSLRFKKEAETIDIVTQLGKKPYRIIGSIRFFDDKGNYLSRSGSINKYPQHPINKGNYHVYTLIWEEDGIYWYIDGEPFFMAKPELIVPHEYGFDTPAYLLMNVSIGGKWAGNPNFLNSFPQEMKIDYIKYYKKNKKDKQTNRKKFKIPNFDGYNKLIWSDDFEEQNIDTSVWIHETNDLWANNEIQAYTDDSTNSFIHDGKLVLRAMKSPAHVQTMRDYTSARLITLGNFNMKYGRLDLRAKMPFGQGIWPAMWMLPVEDKYGGWPFSGEIDIVEVIGDEMKVVHAACHYGWNCKHLSRGIDYHVSVNLSKDFHVYSLIKEKDELWWYFDGVPVHHVSKSLLAPHFFPFNEEFYLILNIAVGGNWPGYPDSTTIFPQTMEVDYVKYFQKN